MAFAPGSLAYATKLKYEYIKEDDVRAADELRGSGKGGGELVGGEKVGRKQALDQLTRVFLPDAGVRSAGAPNEISEVCPSIEELDLEGNPLESWEPVVAIAVQLPQLHWLGLNRLALAPLAALPDGFARGLLPRLRKPERGTRLADLLAERLATQPERFLALRLGLSEQRRALALETPELHPEAIRRRLQAAFEVAVAVDVEESRENLLTLFAARFEQPPKLALGQQDHLSELGAIESEEATHFSVDVVLFRGERLPGSVFGTPGLNRSRTAVPRSSTNPSPRFLGRS